MAATHTPLRSPVIVDTSRSRFARLRPLSMTAVRLNDEFWEPRRRINRTITLPSQYRWLEETGRLRNFQRAAGEVGGEFQGRFFNDSDVYKWLEAASWTLATHEDAELRRQVDQAVRIVAAAQGADGYLDTYFTFEHAGERWTNLRDLHELYCAGHLFQAAVAHHRAVGTRDLLDVALRFADNIADTFGPHGRPGADGHPEVEMALVELARETGEERYLRLAEFFVDQRGRIPPVISGDVYHQDHAPVREQREVTGHAVRALYLYSGVTDICMETGDPTLRRALEALWRNLQERRVYVTGGAGARYEGEAFGDDYELPNERAYAETCAAIAHMMWAWRMLLATGEARFADAMETALYNGALVGVSLDGQAYFYENPLTDRGNHRRQTWFTTSCCPPNLARTLASLPGYLYSTSQSGLWIHLYASSTATVSLDEVKEVTVTQNTTYPWDGEITTDLHLAGPATFSLFLRIPGWCRNASIRVNGQLIPIATSAGSYVEIHRRWESGDVVQLSLPMPVRLIASHPHVTNNYGRVAVQRGPLMYCVEQVDHPEVDVWDLHVPADAAWEAAFDPQVLGGVVVLRTMAYAPADVDQSQPLYYPYDPAPQPRRTAALTAIPYYAWANREAGPMQMWLPIERVDPAV